METYKKHLFLEKNCIMLCHSYTSPDLLQYLLPRPHLFQSGPTFSWGLCVCLSGWIKRVPVASLRRTLLCPTATWQVLWARCFWYPPMDLYRSFKAGLHSGNWTGRVQSWMHANKPLISGTLSSMSLHYHAMHSTNIPTIWSSMCMCHGSFPNSCCTFWHLATLIKNVWSRIGILV